MGLLLTFRCFSSFCVPLFSETAGCRPPLEDRSLWRWDCLSFASVWRGASVTAHHTVGFRFLGWQELQVLFCSWGFFSWLAHLDATQASCVPCVVTCGEAFASSVRFHCQRLAICVISFRCSCMLQFFYPRDFPISLFNAFLFLHLFPDIPRQLSPNLNARVPIVTSNSRVFILSEVESPGKSF